MKRNMFIACGLLSCALTLQAQTRDGGIDVQMMQQIRKAGLTPSDLLCRMLLQPILLTIWLATSAMQVLWILTSL